MTLSRHRKQRAAEAQRLVAAFLRESGLAPNATAVGGGAGGRDVLNVDDVAIEIKACREWEPMAWLRQAKGHAEPGEVSMVVGRPTGGGPTNVGAWPAFMALEDIVRLLQLVQVLRTIADERWAPGYTLATYADDALRDLLDPIDPAPRDFDGHPIDTTPIQGHNDEDEGLSISPFLQGPGPF